MEDILVEEKSRKIKENVPELGQFDENRPDHLYLEENLLWSKGRVRFLEEKIETIRSDRKMREDAAGRIFRFLFCYSLAAGLIIVAQGVEFIPFKLTEIPLAIILGGTYTSAIGLVGLVVKGLFPTPKAAN